MLVKNLLKLLNNFFLKFGFNPRRIITIKYYFKYYKQKKEFISQGGNINKNNMILHDYNDDAGFAKGHYFHQDLIVANSIFKHQPKRHVDIGSRIDGFVSSVASFREIEVIDIRPIKNLNHKNIKFIKANFMNESNLKQTDSLSSLHAIEHFGLGRYSDPIDINGHIKGINNFVKLVSKGGLLYISFPIGIRDEVHFNAHRIFHPKSIFKISSIAENMQLINFDFIDDNDKIFLNANVEDAVNKNKYGCGIYTFKKVTNYS